MAELCCMHTCLQIHLGSAAAVQSVAEDHGALPAALLGTQDLQGMGWEV